MKHLRWIIAMMVALAMAGFLAPQVSAVDPLTGTVLGLQSGYFDTTTGLWVDGGTIPLNGVTVTAYALNRSGSPGKALASTVTNGSGEFSLSVAAQPTVGIKFDPPRASGWQPPPLIVSTARDWTHPMWLIQSWASGQVVDEFGDPIKGALVRYTPWDYSDRYWTDTTDADGWYMISGLDYEEYAVEVTASQYTDGWVNYIGDIVATFGEASTHGTGELNTPGHLIRMTAG